MFGLRMGRKPRVPEISTLASAEDFHDLIRHECKLADRHGQKFSLVVIEVGTSDENSFTARQVVRTLYKRFRTIDEVGWFSRSQIGVFLPYTSARGAFKLAEDVAEMVSKVSPAAPFTIYSYPSHNWPVLPKFDWRQLQPTRLVSRLTAKSTIRNASDFRSLLTLERDRADRNGHIFSLILLDVNQVEGQGVSINRLVHTFNMRLRLTDVIGWYDEKDIGLLLPYTSHENAHRVTEKLVAENRLSFRKHCAIYTYPTQWLPGTRAAQVKGKPGQERREEGSAPEPQRAVVEAVSSGSGGASSQALRVDPDQHSHSAARESNTRPAIRIVTEAETAEEEEPHVVENEAENEAENEDALIDTEPVAKREFAPFVVRNIPTWKRAMDVTGSLVGIAGAAWVMVPIAIAIKLHDGGPIIYKGERAGLGGRPFPFYKFRTMVMNADKMKEQLRAQNERSGPVFKMKNDPRVTPFGRFLRKWSLDELPQFFNVLFGDMSLVGPRPPTMDEVTKYYNWHDKRLEIKPGITCLWQVYARHNSNFDEWVRLDIQYARSKSFLLDCKLLLLTLPAVLSQRGAS
ncbi:MAG: sugar transferase [Myxococcaceae bacterium]